MSNSATATATATKPDFAQAFEAVRSKAEEIKNDKPQYFPVAASPGDTVRQGDLYICFEGDSLKDKLFTADVKKLKKVEKPQKKLVDGNTQGSQHCLESLQGVTVYDRVDKVATDGPILVLEEPRWVTHPEHGHWQLPPGVYSITYQRAFADELRRQMD